MRQALGRPKVFKLWTGMEVKDDGPADFSDPCLQVTQPSVEEPGLFVTSGFGYAHDKNRCVTFPDCPSPRSREAGCVAANVSSPALSTARAPLTQGRCPLRAYSCVLEN